MTSGTAPLPVVEAKTFCGICEASCGLIATIDNDRVTELRPDPDHPTSRGFACSKGVMFHHVAADPDRVLHPMRRKTDGSFARATWEEALDDVGRRLESIQRAHGNESIGIAYGNPVAWSFAAAVTASGLATSLGTRHLYSSASVDVNNYFAAADLLYGNTLIYPLPDFVATDFALIIGANPVVSHGSMVTTGRIRDVLVGIPERGGRVVVVDPRRSETAQLFEHLPIRAGADPWLLAAMLRVIFDEDLIDVSVVRAQTSGIAGLRDMVARFDLDRAAVETGIDAAVIAELARALATARTACVYGRCGASLGRYSTLTKFLLDALAIVTGNLDRRGGMVFGHSMIEAKGTGDLGGSGRNRWKTRVRGVGEVNGTAPMACMAEEITTPGKGRLRALIALSTNFVSSAPGSSQTIAALDELELMVSLDPYLTETSSRAHWVLPPTVWLEREHLPIFTQTQSTVPNAQWVAPLVPAPGEARDDAWILEQIAHRIGETTLGIPGAKLLARIGIRFSPAQLIDLAVRLGPHGDLFGLRRKGLSRRKLMATEGAVKLADDCPVGVFDAKIQHTDRRVHLLHAEIGSEIDRLIDGIDDPRYPLRLFSVRELRSHNSWLHNIPRLMSGDRRCRALMSPTDAAAAGLHDRDDVTIVSAWGEVRVPMVVTDEIADGSVGLTHGWGHEGGWRTAIAAGGANYNVLTPNDTNQIDRPSGNAFLNGIPVTVTRSDER
ncbi:formate dehydrogenase [Nocardia alba]|uniref:Formate dehydrogenase n=2 Tax=Nocardia alba TaxID=225051 RepID=A0A4R1FUY6_9NOCA|nr:formate dehydrogenase [Nocardia alba]